MKKNKSAFCFVVIILSACWPQPLSAALPPKGNGFWRLPLHMNLALGITGLYAWGKYYERKNPTMSMVAGLTLALGGACGMCSVTQLAEAGGPSARDIGTWCAMGLCSMIVGLRMVGSLDTKREEIEDQIDVACRQRKYGSLRELLRKNSYYTTTSVNFRPLAIYIVRRSIESSVTWWCEDFAMLDWLLWFDKKNMHAVDCWGRNVAHYVATDPGLCSTVQGVNIAKRLDAKALNQKDSSDKVPLQYLVDTAEDGYEFAEKTKLMKIMLDNGADMGKVEEYFNEKASSELKIWYKEYLKNKLCGALASVVRMYVDNSGSICKECSGRKACVPLSNDLVVKVTEFLTGRLSCEQKQQCIKSQKESVPKNVNHKSCLC